MSENFSSKFAQSGMEDILKDPEAFGAPTFEQFKKNREKYMGRDDETLALVDRGSHNLKRVVDKYTYEIEGFRCDTLEKVEQIAADYGIALRELDYRPELIPQGGGKAKMLIKFISKEDREKRALWR